ncbi:MAG: cytochrome C oxidase subunit IV family protein [Thiohalobacteraceae bacterium]
MKTKILPTATATRVWLALVALTLTTFTLGVFGYQGIGLVVTVLAIALFKAHLVVDHFMLLRRGAPLWRALLTGYLILIGILIAVPFALAGH